MTLSMLETWISVCVAVCCCGIVLVCCTAGAWSGGCMFHFCLSLWELLFICLSIWENNHIVWYCLLWCIALKIVLVECMKMRQNTAEIFNWMSYFLSSWKFRFLRLEPKPNRRNRNWITSFPRFLRNRSVPCSAGTELAGEPKNRTEPNRRTEHPGLHIGKAAFQHFHNHSHQQKSTVCATCPRV
jgi:hypothetical protein